MNAMTFHQLFIAIVFDSWAHTMITRSATAVCAVFSVLIAYNSLSAKIHANDINK